MRGYESVSEDEDLTSRCEVLRAQLSYGQAHEALGQELMLLECFWNMYYIIYYTILYYLILSYPILSYLILSYLVLSYLILSYIKLFAGMVWPFSRHPVGCRLIQSALEVLPVRLAEQLAWELQGHVKEAATSPHANYVLQKVITQLRPPASSFIAEELLENGPKPSGSARD